MPRKGSIPRLCEACGAQFFVFPYSIRNGNGRYCTRACHSAVQTGMVRRSLMERFTEKVQRTATCWLWTATLNDRGYGQIYVAEKHGRQLAHRAAWEMVAGPIPPGLDVLHTCDNPPCTRNDEIGIYELNGQSFPRRGHLWLGDHLANMTDMMVKERKLGKLTPTQVAAILDDLASGASQNSLAVRLGVTRQAIWYHAKRG